MAGVLLVTGGHGFLGRRVGRLGTAAGWSVIAPTSGELDIRDAGAVRTAIQASRPRAVVHLAYRRSEADTMVDGSRNVARACAESGVRLVHLSTDVVFGGRAAPYTERDDPAPVEAYGLAKADAERAVHDEAPSAAIVRTSLLLGEPDDLGQPQLDVTAALTGARRFAFFSDEVRCPTYATDVAAATLVLAGELSEVGGPLHLAGPEPLTRLELAVRLAGALGLDPAGLEAGTLAGAGLTGRRPDRVVLDCGVATGLGLHCRPA